MVAERGFPSTPIHPGRLDAQGSNRFGSIFVQQLSYDRVRHGHMQEQLGEKVDLTDEYQIAERRRVSDRYHCRLASRIAAISRPRSSIV
jgi:hypothetical protein